MRVLIACEYSGVVRDAFAARGHDAVSCDLMPSEKPGKHYQGDVKDILYDGWDLMIAHPPCTHLAVSGARWFGEKSQLQEEAVEFARLLFDAPITHICIENPISVLATRIKPPSQYIQPYQYGHPDKKKTCLWLKNLPFLRPTKLVKVDFSKTRYMSPSPDRGKLRSLTPQGVADAMAQQWNELWCNLV